MWIQTDPTDKNSWQLNLYRKIGKSQMRGKEEMTHEAVVEKVGKNYEHFWINFDFF